MKQRSIRRAAERQARKQSEASAELRSIHTQNPKQREGHRISPKPECEQVPHTQKPSHRSTGPRTIAGKDISCLNNTSAQGVSLPVVRFQEKTGLTGLFRVHESESQAQFDELRDALRAEHAPATPTELLLVDRLAEHAWLSQRAQRIGDAAWTDHNETWFALMLRYRTTHDPAFHKCLAELRTIRRERGHENKQAEAHRPLDAAPDERGTSRVWPHLASPLCASSSSIAHRPLDAAQNKRGTSADLAGSSESVVRGSSIEFESQNAVGVPEVLVEAAPEFESQTPKKYTKAELDALSDAEVSALVQAALKKANINLSDFDNYDDEVRIAEFSEAA